MANHEQQIEGTGPGTPGVEPNAAPVTAPVEPASPADTATGLSTGEGALHLVTQLQKQLDALRTGVDQAARRAQELDRRHNELVELARALKGEREQFESAKANEEAQRAQREERSAEALRALEGELARRRAELEAKAAGMQAEAAALALQRESILHEAQRLDERERTASEQGQALQARELQLGERAQQIEQQHAALSSRERAAQEREQAFEQRGQALDARERALGEREAQAGPLAEQLGQARAELDTTRAELTTAHAELATARAEAEANASRSSQDRAELERSLAGERERLGQELAQARQKAEQAGAALAGLRGELDAAAAQIESLKREHAAARGAAASGAQAGEQLAQLTKERDALAAKVNELEGALRDAAAASAARDQEAQSAAELRAELDKREDALRVLAERLLRAEERSIQHQAELNEAVARAEEAGRASAQADRPVGDGGASPSAAVSLRRERLARYKQLLNAQSRKVVQAKAALQRRQSECEQVLASRAKLLEQAAALNTREQQIAAKQGKSHAGILGVCVAAAVSMIAGAAWTLAGKVAPSQYAARAVIEADSKIRENSAEELASWTATHKELLTDPMVIQQAAENFGRRAMASLATPTAVKEKVDRDLYVQSDEAGKINIEWRSQGAERSARELETYLSAVLSVSDAQRQVRGDGAATSLAQAATSGQEPLDREQWIYAAAIAVGGSVLVAGVTLGGYAAMKRTRSNFDRETAALEAA
jgi:chromosome segregation ATPase